MQLIKEKYEGKNVTVLPIGKKGADFFAKQDVTTRSYIQRSFARIGQ
jgi:F0F1-type ATP synthase gamma subunit